MNNQLLIFISTRKTVSFSNTHSGHCASVAMKSWMGAVALVPAINMECLGIIEVHISASLH